MPAVASPWLNPIRVKSALGRATAHPGRAGFLWRGIRASCF